MSSQPLTPREEYLKKKRTKRLVKFGVILFLILAFITGLVLLSRIQKLRISSIELTGNVLVSKEEVVKTAKEYLAGNYLWFFPKNNILLYPKKKLQIVLQDKFKRIDTITLDLKNFQTLSIAITERDLNSLWCDNAPDSELPEKCYFMDSNSLIFSESPEFSGDAYFKYYGRVATDTSPIGTTYFATSSLFKDVGTFIYKAREIGLHPVYFYSALNEQYMVGLSGGGYIYISQDEPLEKSAENLKALLMTISATTTYSSLNFDYIDLRFGNRLYYKLK